MNKTYSFPDNISEPKIIGLLNNNIKDISTSGIWIRADWVIGSKTLDSRGSGKFTDQWVVVPYSEKTFTVYRSHNAIWKPRNLEQCYLKNGKIPLLGLD